MMQKRLDCDIGEVTKGALQHNGMTNSEMEMGLWKLGVLRYLKLLPLNMGSASH